MANSTINIFGNSGEAMVGADTINTILASMDSKLTSDDINIETLGDGTVDVDVKNDTYTINLNHTHENMAKLIVCEESDLPSTLDNSTIYAITDSGETEIEKLIIRGMEFAGGGVPSTEPKIVSPIGTQIDFNGASTKTVTVRATNLSEALTIAVTGITANLQTISANDAANGVQLTLTKGQNFASGTLRIYNSEVDKSWNAFDSQGYQPLTAVKLTGTQWLKTPYKPNAATTVTMICRFEENEHTIVNDQTNHGYYFMGCEQNSSSERFLFYAFKSASSQYQLIAIVPATPIKKIVITGFLTDRSEFKVSPQLMSFTPNGGTAQTVALGATPTMLKELEIGRGTTDAFGTQIFNYYDLTIYELTISEGSTTVHHYLPRLKNGVPGLYDTETDTFISSETSDELVVIPLT